MSAPSQARHIVNFITGNANKLGEVKAILEPAIQVENQALDLLEIQGTLEEVTLDKCRRAADLVSFWLSATFFLGRKGYGLFEIWDKGIQT